MANGQKHSLITNDPTGANAPDNHVAPFVGTAAQRAAYPTGNLRSGDMWFETDTEDLYFWGPTNGWKKIYTT